MEEGRLRAWGYDQEGVAEGISLGRRNKGTEQGF